MSDIQKVEYNKIDLRCCANCGNYSTVDPCIYASAYLNKVTCLVCVRWNYDEMTYMERIRTNSVGEK